MALSNVLAVQVSSQLDGVEELQNIRMVPRSSGGESANMSKLRVRVKRVGSVLRGNERERRKVRVMSE